MVVHLGVETLIGGFDSRQLHQILGLHGGQQGVRTHAVRDRDPLGPPIFKFLGLGSPPLIGFMGVPHEHAK